MSSQPHHLPQAEPKAGRIVQLDALRGVAAIWVMLYHYTIQYAGDFGHGPGAWRVPYGPRAVELFFMISGFVIPMTLGRTRAAMDFVVSRFSRLYPTFWACLIITAAITALARLPGAGAIASIGNVLSNATMAPHLLLHRPYVDPSYWTLEVELLFYITAFIAWRLGGIRGVTMAIGGLTLLSFCDGLLVWLKIGQINGVISSLLMLSFIAYFACGYAAWHFRERRPDGTTALLLLLAAAAVLVRGGSGSLATAALLGATVFLAAFDRFPGLSVRPLLFVGSISYPLYLLHQNIGYAVIRGGYGLGMTANVNILLAIAVSVLLGTAISYSIERPAMRWIRTAYRRAREM